MKELRSLINSLIGCGFAFALVSTLAAQTPIEGTATVIRLKGAARYSVGNSGWKPLKIGQVLKPGTVVQTDMSKDSYIDLVLSEGSAATPVLFNPTGPGAPVGFQVPEAGEPYKPAAAQNVVRIWQNTVLGIDKLTSTETGVDVVTETQLDLKAGYITGVVKKRSAASRYEIKIPDGVAGIRGTAYTLHANGEASVTDGSMVLVRTKKGVTSSTTPPPGQPAPAPGTPPSGAETATTVINGGHQYDPLTDQVTPMSGAAIESLNSTGQGMTAPISKVSPPSARDLNQDLYVTPH